MDPTLSERTLSAAHSRSPHNSPWANSGDSHAGGTNTLEHFSGLRHDSNPLVHHASAHLNNARIMDEWFRHIPNHGDHQGRYENTLHSVASTAEALRNQPQLSPNRHVSNSMMQLDIHGTSNVFDSGRTDTTFGSSGSDRQDSIQLFHDVGEGGSRPFMASNLMSEDNVETPLPYPVRESDDDAEEDDFTLESGPGGNSKYAGDVQSRETMLACPFFKKDPERCYQMVRRGNGRKWKACIGPGWKSTHRLKEHLYKTHKQVDDDGSEGFGPQQEKDIRSRRKPKGVLIESETDKWIRIFRILFPDHHGPIPSPYYESPANNPRDHPSHQPDDLESTAESDLVPSTDEELRTAILKSIEAYRGQFGDDRTLSLLKMASQGLQPQGPERPSQTTSPRLEVEPTYYSRDFHLPQAQKAQNHYNSGQGQHYQNLRQPVRPQQPQQLSAFLPLLDLSQPPPPPPPPPMVRQATLRPGDNHWLENLQQQFAPMDGIESTTNSSVTGDWSTDLTPGEGSEDLYFLPS